MKTDREKLTAILDAFGSDYEDKNHSTVIPCNRTKILWTDDGRIRSIIRNGKSYGPGEEK